MAIRITQLDGVTKFRMARKILGRPFYWTTAYLVDGLLIDTGPRHTIHELADALESRSLHTVVNTHSHEDHVGANAELKRRFNPDIYAHPNALEYLADPYKRKLHPYQLIMWGRPPPSSAKPLNSTLETENHTFRVLETPGHGEDHICLFEPEMGWLFSGDIYVGGKDKTLRKDFNVWKIIESLKFLASFQPEVIFPGSGNEKAGGTAELTRKIEYLETTGARVLELSEKGLGPEEIRKRLFGPELIIRYITLGHYSGKNLVNSFINDKP